MQSVSQSVRQNTVSPDGSRAAGRLHTNQVSGHLQTGPRTLNHGWIYNSILAQKPCDLWVQHSAANTHICSQRAQPSPCNAHLCSQFVECNTTTSSTNCLRPFTRQLNCRCSNESTNRSTETKSEIFWFNVFSKEMVFLPFLLKPSRPQSTKKKKPNLIQHHIHVGKSKVSRWVTSLSRVLQSSLSADTRLVE